MSQFMRKMFSLNDIKYSWILLLSIILCFLIFYIDRADLLIDSAIVTTGYLLSFSIAVLWGAINYIGHIRMNVMYQKQNNIHAYVAQLALSQEDKWELQAYLEDFAEDLIQQGKTKEDASIEAINHFKVQEILSLSKNTLLFNLHAHYYLLGWVILACIFFTFIGVFWIVLFASSTLLLIVESMLFAYSLGFVGLFFVYKLFDAMIYRKLKENVS
ncbi:hypothetical protein LIS82_02145 [Cytobacillus solani]|uniref:Uncharacterized protein n=1 Tax=Cytobacillus solani TaxID=1637975 RepID=A0A0Q3T201_9BACI|nr:hypothetical protein [Cytobacillus solani]KOP77673.1 hypothetical protein AMS60_19125 [Bacillus sp. FJAT-21945]KQL17533.1 hypothetical protein AN957_02020 [Cytobacillus solani]USK55391.1 hypothetical protein LIS82_02145 [Cytobacillus solani]